MNTNKDTKNKKCNFDKIKWILSIIFFVIAISGNYYFKEYNSIFRIIIVFIIIIISGIPILLTKKGKLILVFLREARFEIRKVIWPTKQETIQTTLIIAAVTSLMALILWGLDSILVRFVSFIIGLKF